MGSIFGKCFDSKKKNKGNLEGEVTDRNKGKPLNILNVDDRTDPNASLSEQPFIKNVGGAI